MSEFELKKRLDVLRQDVVEMKWLNAPERACYLIDAVDDMKAGKNVAIALWWKHDDEPLFAGMDWIELIALENDGVIVNRIIEPIWREREEKLHTLTPVLVFS